MLKLKSRTAGIFNKYLFAQLDLEYFVVSMFLIIFRVFICS